MSRDIVFQRARVRGFTTWEGGSTEPRLFSPADSAVAGDSHIYVWSNATNEYDDDDGADIAAAWVSQYSDFGYPGEKTIREIEVWGSGTVRVQVGSDFRGSAQGALTTASVLTLGSEDSNGFRLPTPARFRTSARGHFFAIGLDNSDGENKTNFQVDRIVVLWEPSDQQTLRADSNT